MYRVILVEDEKIIRKGIRHAIPWEEYGCCVVGEAGDGEEGKRLIEALSPDIVITDIRMPVMDGLAMLARTKLRCGYAAVIMTGCSEFEYAREAIKTGVSGYVLKPLHMREMREALDRAVLEAENIRCLRRKNEKDKELLHISLLEEPKECQDPVAEQVLAYLGVHYRSKILLSDLGRQLHYSERYLNQRFQKAFGATVIEYLNRYRIQKALELIREGALPLSEVGYECGIGEYKYFNYVFKKYLGCSAKEYQIRIFTKCSGN